MPVTTRNPSRCPPSDRRKFQDKQARDVERAARTAAEAGWHESRYNIAARIPGSKAVAIYNTYLRTCAEYASWSSSSWTRSTRYRRPIP